MEPGAQVCITNLSPNLISYLPTFYHFIISHIEKSNDRVDPTSKEFNPGFPHNSPSDNREAGGSEHGSRNMDQYSNIGGSPSKTSP